MNAVTLIMLIFAVIGAVDYLLGNRFGLGGEFERGFNLLGILVLSMVGIITLSPLIANLLEPAFGIFYDTFHIDPSIIPASIFANDLGGAALSKEAARDPLLGGFNGLVVSSMMGGLVSFYIPFSVGTVKREHHSQLFFGLLCGTVTIPVGCFIGGLICGISLPILLLNLLPLIIFSGIIALGLWFCPRICVKIFGIFGEIMKVVLVVGLMLGVVQYLTGFELIKGLAPIEEGAMICFNICCILAGAFPLMAIVSRLFRRPLTAMAKLLGTDETATAGLLSMFVTAPPVFEMMNRMDKKGIVINAAFVSGCCVFGDHLAFTLAFDDSYILSMIVSKLISGICGMALAVIIYKRAEKRI